MVEEFPKMVANLLLSSYELEKCVHSLQKAQMLARGAVMACLRLHSL